MQAKYQVSVLDLQYDRFINKIKDVPVVFVWAIGENLTCEKALQDPETFACKYKNTTCYSTSNTYGYRCDCLSGYEGNLYLINGCQDVNECEDHNDNQCASICINNLQSLCCACQIYKCHNV
ncbi:hypothetical protein GIB67_015300 [Kingdonia uniflora]|uniref:B box-type domain-containing protein n=1 Tax=Kingdonia uniflora TaxID=39325 RepID=A0A7J7LMA9_9MAGN|nr:hypothetical protein GIB67_015300 [Kingdonia uniflora]